MKTITLEQAKELNKEGAFSEVIFPFIEFVRGVEPQAFIHGPDCVHARAYAINTDGDLIAFRTDLGEYGWVKNKDYNAFQFNRSENTMRRWIRRRGFHFIKKDELEKFKDLLNGDFDFKTAKGSEKSDAWELV